MTFGEILSTVLLTPLHLIFEFIFKLSNQALNNPGFSIMALSLAVNLLLMPLYRRADALQKEEREAEKRLEKGIAHIKKTFQGDERMMILQAYYREHHYKPTYALRSAAPLLLQIPFFIAAYRFLSGLTLLQQASFGPIADLSRPDRLLHLGGATINLLPFVMTAVNMTTAALFTKGGTKKEKLQLYGMAAFFLVFLYNSPSALVFYWTLNNVFSLGKTLLGKWKHAGAFLRGALAVGGLGAAVYGILTWDHFSFRSLAVWILVGFALMVPELLYLLRGRFSGRPLKEAPNGKLFLTEALFLSALLGVLIPSNVIQASPEEFVNTMVFFHPNWYVVSAFCITLGTFAVWLGVFYLLASPSGKVLFERILFVFCGVAILNYLFFGTNMGNMTPNLEYDFGMNFSRKEQLLNLLCVLALAAALLLLLRVRKIQWVSVVFVCAAAILCMSAVNIVKINTAVAECVARLSSDSADDPNITLTKSGKNVVVLMMDRAIAHYIPYFLEEKPELKTQLDGFVYYDNCVSLGNKTNTGTPSLYGGYDYTPAKMNARDTELNIDKHNEALKVLPTLFGQNGFETTIFDPPWAGYTWNPDLRIYDGMEHVKAYNSIGAFSSMLNTVNSQQNTLRNFFCFSLTKTMPLILQPIFYDNANYNRIRDLTTDEYLAQSMLSFHEADGLDLNCMNSFEVMERLELLTEIVEEDTNQLFLLRNLMPHYPMLMQEPDYLPSFVVDNQKYDATHADRFTVDGKTLSMELNWHYAFYETNMSWLLQVVNWLEYLKETGVYDNTRIIICSDHGYPLAQLEELVLDNGFDIMRVASLLMVKDFGASGEIQTSHQFMTAADVPTILTEGLIENPVNPFTGNPISSADKTAHVQYIYSTYDWNAPDNNGTTFTPGEWLTVHDDIWNKENWRYLTDSGVISEEK